MCGDMWRRLRFAAFVANECGAERPATGLVASVTVSYFKGMENPYEPKMPGPYTARVRAPQRRGADYHLPPMGSGRIVDKAHHRREEWTCRLALLIFLGGPLAYVLGVEFGIF